MRIRDSVVLGSEPTPLQDLEFSLRQLVEVALRSMSSDFRDYYTAAAVLNRLTLSLARIMQRGAPDSSWRDDDDNVRVLGPKRDLARMLDHSFGLIRQRGGAFPALMVQATEKLRQLAIIAPEEHRPAVERHAELMRAAAQRSLEETDADAGTADAGGA
jgi:uncharacterized membrane protein